MGQRFWEIDFLRGVAIIMMVVFHTLFDLNYFGYYNIDVMHSLRYFAIATASIFIFVSGICTTISYSKRKSYTRRFIRGAEIFGFGLIATFVTWVFLKEGFVVFGILHFIGISIIASYFFVRFKKLNFLMGIALVTMGIYLQGLVFNFPWLLWLGLRMEGFYSVDYFPMLPWYGLFLFGLSFGNKFYPNGRRGFHIPNFKNKFIKGFCFLGRHSLLIYLLHQIFIVGILYIIF